jgi:hypothetical protein
MTIVALGGRGRTISLATAVAHINGVALANARGAILSRLISCRRRAGDIDRRRCDEEHGRTGLFRALIRSTAISVGLDVGTVIVPAAPERIKLLRRIHKSLILALSGFGVAPIVTGASCRPPGRVQVVLAPRILGGFSLGVRRGLGVDRVAAPHVVIRAGDTHLLTTGGSSVTVTIRASADSVPVFCTGTLAGSTGLVGSSGGFSVEGRLGLGGDSVVFVHQAVRIGEGSLLSSAKHVSLDIRLPLASDSVLVPQIAIIAGSGRLVSGMGGLSVGSRCGLDADLVPIVRIAAATGCTPLVGGMRGSSVETALWFTDDSTLIVPVSTMAGISRRLRSTGGSSADVTLGLGTSLVLVLHAAISAGGTRLAGSTLGPTVRNELWSVTNLTADVHVVVSIGTPRPFTGACSLAVDGRPGLGVTLTVVVHIAIRGGGDRLLSPAGGLPSGVRLETGDGNVDTDLDTVQVIVKAAVTRRLKHVLALGIGWHHAGLLSAGRSDIHRPALGALADLLGGDRLGVGLPDRGRDSSRIPGRTAGRRAFELHLRDQASASGMLSDASQQIGLCAVDGETAGGALNVQTIAGPPSDILKILRWHRQWSTTFPAARRRGCRGRHRSRGRRRRRSRRHSRGENASPPLRLARCSPRPTDAVIFPARATTRRTRRRRRQRRRRRSLVRAVPCPAAPRGQTRCRRRGGGGPQADDLVCGVRDVAASAAARACRFSQVARRGAVRARAYVRARASRAPPGTRSLRRSGRGTWRVHGGCAASTIRLSNGGGRRNRGVPGRPARAQVVLVVGSSSCGGLCAQDVLLCLDQALPQVGVRLFVPPAQAVR